MTKRQVYANRLAQCLAGQLTKNAVEHLCAEFESLAEKYGEEKSFSHIWNNYGSGTLEVAIAGIKEELEKLNRENFIDVNPKTRLIKYAKRFNSVIDKLQMEVFCDGFTEDDIKKLNASKENIKIRLPKSLDAQMFESTAKTTLSRRPVKLELSVKYV